MWRRVSTAVLAVAVFCDCSFAQEPTAETKSVEAAADWLQSKAGDMIRASHRTMQDGTAAFPPQVDAGYEAFWLRDYAYMLEGSAEAFSDDELRHACLLFVNAQRADGACVDCVKFDGTPIYMPGYGTMGENPVADGSQFTVAVAWHTHQRLQDAPFIKTIVGKLVQAMQAVPRNPDNGLVHIADKGWDRCPYGFTDSVRKQGDVLFCSLLYVVASRQLADLLEVAERCDEARTWRTEAGRVSQSVRDVLWDSSLGLFRAATLRCKEPDIWGSAYAVYLDVASEEQKLAIARYFKEHYGEIVQRGQVRHLPGGMFWEEACGQGGYQNGGYWATPVGWFAYTLDLVDPQLADRTVIDMVRELQQNQFAEWVNGDQKGVLNYTANAALPIAGIRRMLQRRSANRATIPMALAELDALAGQPVDIAPWSYVWRSDRQVQERSEAHFIPRRLARLDNVYRTAFHAMPEEQRKSQWYQMPELLEPLLEKPLSPLQVGLLWRGRLEDYRVELRWPADAEIPAVESVEVRAFPTPFGWFGWTKDEVLTRAEVSGDGRVWTYRRSSREEIPIHVNIEGKDWYRSGSGTEMVAVFYERKNADGRNCGLPTVRVLSPRIGNWRRMDIEIEWGFLPETEHADFDGRIEPFMAIAGPVAPLADDKSVPARRGIAVSLLYAPDECPPGDPKAAKGTEGVYNGDGRPALDSQITLWSSQGGFTFRVRDLDNGPIFIPRHGVFITKAGGMTARQFVKELAAKNLKSLRQLTRERNEDASWEDLMRRVRFAGGSAPEKFPPFPEVADPPMQVELSDRRWTGAWRTACDQMRSRSPYEWLAYEGARTAHGMDLVALHDEADKIYQHFLKAPGAKADGDFTDGDGSLEWAAGMRHDMGYGQDGTHPSTGKLLFSMADRYFLTGDKPWFERNRARLQAAADWIVRQRTTYLKDVPNRQDLLAAGLMPPFMLGDYALPSSDWHWYYCTNAFDLKGLQRFADALADFDPRAAEKYRREAEAFREDIRRIAARDAALSPVRLGRDGVYHAFLPLMCYGRGAIMSMEWGSLQRPQADVLIGSLPLAEPFAAMDPDDSIIADTLGVMDEIGSSPKVNAYILPPNIAMTLDVMDEITASVRRAPENGDPKSGNVPAADAWFRSCYGGSLPKASHNADIFLLQDDIPNFLRFFFDSYALMTGADGKLWEWGRTGNFTNCEVPDNGTAGWFLEQFRNLLVMETQNGKSLWIARGTPRAWLQQGKMISVANAPTYFGPLTYQITSDADHGRITATIHIPHRTPPREIVVRFRHPRAEPIQSATVDGKPWNDFDSEKEIIRLHNPQGTVKIAATYSEKQ